MTTLTSVYADSTIVLGPLAAEAQPGACDLCDKHVSSFTVPRSWQIIRLATEFEPAPPSEDDLLALVDTVREASRASRPVASPAEHRPRPGGIMPASLATPLPPPPEVAEDEILQRGHLRVLHGQGGDARAGRTFPCLSSERSSPPD